MDRIETLESRGSQSRLSTAIYFVLLAALLFRVVTALAGREKEGASHSRAEAPPNVRWTALEKASALSAGTGKPVLYDFTAEWCVPCHRLDQEGWGDAELADIANDHFLPVRVMDREHEEGKNPPRVAELQQKYSVQAFPTLVVAGPDGKEIARSEGWGGAAGLRQFLEEARAKSKP